MPSYSLKVERKGHVAPQQPGPAVDLELSGSDVMFNGMNVRVTLYFDDVVSKEVLKSSLAKVLTGFPLLSSRVTKQSNRAFCPMNGPGPLVYEQHLVVTGAPNTKPLEPVLQKLVRGKVISPNKAPTMILTLTEVEYRVATPFQCRPAACTSHDDEKPASQEGEGGDSSDLGNKEDLQRPRFVIGVCINHDVADGSAINHFLMCWALASVKRPFPPPATHDRGMLLSTNPDPETEGSSGKPLDMPSHLAHVGFFGRLHMGASLFMDKYSFVMYSLEFTPVELEAIKAAAMEPLKGSGTWVSTSNALCAHLWPILTELMPYPVQDGNLCPLSMIINFRKHVGMHPTYFGNAASVKSCPETTTEETLSERALKIRRTCELSDIERLRCEVAYLEQAKRDGKAGSIAFGPMLDAVAKRPSLVWDDVSGFQIPEGAAGASMGLAGVTVTDMDFVFDPMPGMALVLPKFAGGGKRVIVGLHKKDVEKVESPEWQERIHAYRSVPVTVEVNMSEDSKEESKSEQ